MRSFGKPGYDDDESIAQAANPMPDEPQSELGHAGRLIVVYGDRLRYVLAWRRWLVWDGQRWPHDDTGRARLVQKLRERVGAR